MGLNPAIKKVLRIPFIVLLLALLSGTWLWFGEGGFARLFHSEAERQACIDRIRKLAAENETLLNEVHLLRTDPEYLESVARRDLNLIKENEVVYILKNENGSDAIVDGLERGKGGLDSHDGVP